MTGMYLKVIFQELDSISSNNRGPWIVTYSTFSKNGMKRKETMQTCLDGRLRKCQSNRSCQEGSFSILPEFHPFFLPIVACIQITLQSTDSLKQLSSRV